MSKYTSDIVVRDVDAAALSDPDALNRLRSTVEDWLDRAEQAVWTFERHNGLFQRDSAKSDHSSITTTARCYMALAYAERSRKGTSNQYMPDWRSRLNSYLANKPFQLEKGEFVVSQLGKDESDKNFNNFEIAHLADFVFAKKFAERFPDDEGLRDTIQWPTGEDALAENGKKIATSLDTLLSTTEELLAPSATEIPFDEGANPSRHYFVTLHILRALHILRPDHGPPRSALTRIANDARRFCIEQCFYSQRGIRHKQDPARLVFASTIYCMYAEEVDQEVMLAITESVASMQEPSGKWPASHPIVRGKQKGAWYIASSELALCLTWLYFQPKLPDTARTIILVMLQGHFRNWVVPTFRHVHSELEGADHRYSGWPDDSAIGEDKVVGWTTAIICHLLSNYLDVLDDHINRAVIESLHLQGLATTYLIDETATKRNPRWSRRTADDAHMRPWTDLPPIAWKASTAVETIAGSLSRHWSDPELHSKLSLYIASDLLAPILSQPSLLPRRDMVAGILDGPPGTRKTSLVKRVAAELQWPYVPVPASAIFDSGFDSMEARASTVFRRLNYLTRCVIFFDEFEEFFRDRTPTFNSNGSAQETDSEQEATAGQARTGYLENAIPEGTRFSPHDRTIAAFTTSAMLARVQDLHDVARSLVFLATNHFDKLDDAIVRSGRFDFRERIDHPVLGRFEDTAEGFFANPTEKTLTLLRTTRGSSDLLEVRRIIGWSIRQDCMKENFKNLSTRLKQEGSNSDSLRLPFSMIEQTAQHVIAGIKDKIAVSALEKSAVSHLSDLIRKVVSHDKGPGPLPSRSSSRESN